MFNCAVALWCSHASHHAFSLLLQRQKNTESRENIIKSRRSQITHACKFLMSKKKKKENTTTWFLLNKMCLFYFHSWLFWKFSLDLRNSCRQNNFTTRSISSFFWNLWSSSDKIVLPKEIMFGSSAEFEYLQIKQQTSFHVQLSESVSLGTLRSYERLNTSFHQLVE